MSNYIDFHIEISALLHFVNEQIESNTPIPINKEETFDCFKRVVISSGIKPFLLAEVANEDNLYYEKYVRFENEFQDKFIPDFFSHNGDFYDLYENLNIAKRNTNDKVFQHLFLIKMLEISSATLSMNDFFDFQLYDNFYGDKEGFACFLVLLTEKNTNPYLLPIISAPINKWITDNDQTEVFNFIENEIDNNKTEEEDTPEKDGNHQDIVTNPSIVNEVETPEKEDIHQKQKDEEFYASKRNFKLQGHFTDDEIRHYFSFLYLERGADKQPFLSEEAVTQIFKHGLLIPQEPLLEKFELHRDPRIPKGIVDFAIHKLMTKNSRTSRDKNDYLIFMGSYIKNYVPALHSLKKLINIAKNISGEKTSRSSINWNNYLPERFQD